MKKRRLILIVLLSAVSLYYIGSFLYVFIVYTEKSNNDFSYVDKTLKMSFEDSSYFTENTKSQLAIQYSGQYKKLHYFSLYRYKKNYNFIIRKLSDNTTNLKNNFKVVHAKNQNDGLVTYDLNESYQFIYKVDIDRSHGPNKNLIIDGKNIEVLKHTKDSLLIHGNIYDLSIGKKDEYVNEGLYMQDETFFRTAINTELLIFNRDDKLYFYILFPDGQQIVPKGILNEIR
ncbi:hypothetical protein [Fluviicola taffensis]|uniref:Uncharacterized protein n=1 Tax=Fluviicola taffensis (strain DSM 16823 / NCIMB 13979 / RW262) TaxID=755732 RepID=F2IHG4_FLUTR|nr:hypothetical protein [Fluviicola taffensis]AEA43729.1 hypothetical protein Fluta_1737 [Fluviicola taffensis DSM 16823]